jgi:predicted anti-sigma-YlaC factor YlaD
MSDELPEARVVRDELVDPEPVPLLPPEQFEADLADFTRAARRRNTWVMAIAAFACFAIGLTVAVVGVVAKQGSDGTWAQARGEAGELRMFMYAIGFVVAGAFLARSAYRIARGVTS